MKEISLSAQFPFDSFSGQYKRETIILMSMFFQGKETISDWLSPWGEKKASFLVAVSVCQCCHYTVPQIGHLQQQNFIVSQVWRLDAQKSRCLQIWFCEGFSLAYGWFYPVDVFQHLLYMCVCLCSNILLD